MMGTTLKDKFKHGTSQYRLNYAKSIAANILENVNRIEVMWQLSKNDHMSIDEDVADDVIRGLIGDTDAAMISLKGYLKYREDMSSNSKDKADNEL